MASSVPPLDDARRPDEFLVFGNHLASDADCVSELKLTTALASSIWSEQAPLLQTVASLVAISRSQLLSGLIRAPPLPLFPLCWRAAMESSRQYQIPQTPRVISPSPTPSEAGSAQDGYFGPVTRSSTRKKRQQDRFTSPPPIDEDSSGSDPEKRARARSRSPILEGSRRRMSGLTSRRQLNGIKRDLAVKPNGTVNGHLSPAAANKMYWREMSRSPSPLGLIPIHQEWRRFVRVIRSSYQQQNANSGRFTNTKYHVRYYTFRLGSSPSSFTVRAHKPRRSTLCSSRSSSQSLSRTSYDTDTGRSTASTFDVWVL